MSPDHLLPANATPLERALSQSTGRFVPARLVAELWNAQTCPESALPYLAWALSVDQWDSTWPVQIKRDTISAARLLHQRKGTPWSIRHALAIMGHADAIVIERADYIRHDGQAKRNGWHTRRGQDGWATFRVVLQRPITIDQSVQLRALLDTMKRNCVHLVALDYSEAALRHNGMYVRDGSYTRGVIN